MHNDYKQHLESLENIIGHKFSNSNLLIEAISHPSLAIKKNKSSFDYERLEFLGDSVLSLVIAEQLYLKFIDSTEAKLAMSKNNLVSKSTISLIARSINLGELIIMSHGEENSGGRENNSNLENCLEAIIGAVYIDAGLERAKAFIITLWQDILASPAISIKDAKSSVQEWAQKNQLPIPQYNLLSQSGTSHEPLFEIELCVLNCKRVVATGANKKEAEKKAAALFIAENNI